MLNEMEDKIKEEIVNAIKEEDGDTIMEESGHMIKEENGSRIKVEHVNEADIDTSQESGENDLPLRQANAPNEKKHAIEAPSSQRKRVRPVSPKLSRFPEYYLGDIIISSLPLLSGLNRN